MKSLVTALAMSSLIAAAPVSASDTAVADFSIGASSYRISLPEGLCLPTGKQAEGDKVLADADPNSVTYLSLDTCDGMVVIGAATESLAIKAPKRWTTIKVDHAQFIATMAPQFDAPRSTVDPTRDDKIARNVGDKIGGKPEIVTSLGPRGHDDFCGYLGGTGSVKMGRYSYVQAIGICVTSVDGHLFEVIRGGRDTSAEGVDKLMRQARATAMTIRPAPTK